MWSNVLFRVKASRVLSMSLFLFSSFDFFYFWDSTFETVCLFGWHCSIDLLVRYSKFEFFIQFFVLFFRTCPPLCFCVVVKIFVTAIWRQIHFKSFFFVCSCNFHWIAGVTSSFTLTGASFFIRLLKFLVRHENKREECFLFM